MKFEEFGLAPEITEGLIAMGFETATPIQAQAIPVLMEKRDILACAQTGTGKTAAFLLPILHHIVDEPPHKGIDTLILEPTRELAVQVDQQLDALSYFTGTSSIAIYGGRDGNMMEQERRAIKQGVDIIVATPGRFLAHLQLGYVDLSNVRHLVLDEADRMLDMGFVQDMMTIISQLPKERQTLLFSATMPSQIRTFAKNILRKPVEISIAISKPAEGITQAAYMVEDAQKNRLIEILLRTQKEHKKRMLIFASSKKSTKELAGHLSRKGFPAADIHSDLDQAERESRLQAFRNNSVPILVATDVLSRGIDIKGIEVVINFDVPGDPEDYVHRIGRTARADETGLALTLVTKMTKRKYDRIEKLTGIKIKILPLPPEMEGGPSPRPDLGGERKSKNRSRGGKNRRPGGGGGGGHRGGGGQGGGGGQHSQRPSVPSAPAP